MDVNSCYEDSKNRLWFASLAGGLSRLDRKTEKFYTITKTMAYQVIRFTEFLKIQKEIFG